MTRTLLLFPLLALALAGCEAVPGGGGQTVSATSDLCLASTWEGRFLGVTEAQARSGAAPLIREGKAQITGPGQPGAGGSRPDRLTFELGRDGRVARIFCA